MMSYLIKKIASAMRATMKKNAPEGVNRFPNTCFTHLTKRDKNQETRIAAKIPKSGNIGFKTFASHLKPSKISSHGLLIRF